MIKELAAREKKTVQWARGQRRKSTPLWRAFVETKSNPATATAEPPPAAPLPDAAPADAELSRARWMSASAFDALRRAEAAARHYESDPAMMVTAGRALREARRIYEDATRHQKRLEIEAQQYIPLAAVRDIRAAMSRLAEVVQQFRVRIAGRLPQDHRAAFYAAFDEARAGWNDGIRAVDTYIESLLPC